MKRADSARKQVGREPINDSGLFSAADVRLFQTRNWKAPMFIQPVGTAGLGTSRRLTNVGFRQNSSRSDLDVE